MALLHKIYGVILSDFKKEICRDPDADFTSRIQELAAEFGKREKSVIDKLFLTLYDQDALSLKTDLCKLRASKPAKAAPSDKQRTTLLACLYGVLSSYIGENYASITAMCNRGVGITQEPCEKLLDDFKEEVRRDPDADLDPQIKDLAAEFAKRRTECEKNIFDELFLYLYAQNTASLERELTKLCMLRPTKKATPSERADLLPHLCEALSSHIKKDFSDIIAMCDARGA